MRATMPWLDIPGDSPDKIMNRSGYCIGMSEHLAVWRFGFSEGSDAAEVWNVHITQSEEDEEYGFLWVLATRKTAKIKETFRGYALELPDSFRKVIDWGQ